ncbi:hypothetical protein P4O66_017239, partial [Electrophorus voltai]
MGDEWNTAFIMTRGHHEYLVMPYGLSNSPSVFQAFMDEIFRDMMGKFLIVYIDDILVFSQSEAENVDHVTAILTHLRQHCVYAKAKKFEFHRNCVTFLGCTLKPGVLSMDPDKVTAIQNWPKPTTIKELQRFLGFVNFDRRFIQGFGDIAAPLSDLLKKQGRQQLPWTMAADQAFLTLKGGLCFGTHSPRDEWDDSPTDIQALDQWFQQSSRTWEVTHIHLQTALRTRQMFANRHRNPNLQLHPGQTVWVSTLNMRLRLPSKKVSPSVHSRCFDRSTLYPTSYSFPQ